jgi:hypothetical protein
MQVLMRTSEISFLGHAERITLQAYNIPNPTAEVISRLAALILLSPAAACDVAFHGLMILPTFVYCIGESIVFGKIDFTLPWQHLQRVRNAVFPILLGSAFGLIHPYAGLALCEPTDRHIVAGILSSNRSGSRETPCSPIHTASIVKDLAKAHRFVAVNGVEKEIYSEEHIQILEDTQSYEKSLQSLQAQEFIHKITNITLFAMAEITRRISLARIDSRAEQILIRLSGVLIPVFACADLAVTLVVQAFFTVTGVVRLVTGRGPIYTEVTSNPLMHAAFLIQNILKAVGTLVGNLVWFVSPQLGFQISLLPANLFFKAQMALLMQRIKLRMYFSQENSRFMIPIVYGEGPQSALSVPTHSMHKTYLIVEKKNGVFNLYWVNRPNVSQKKELDKDSALTEIRSMLDERFPFMDIEKLLKYPVRGAKPSFANSSEYIKIGAQGGGTNCVVSNLFGALEALDRIRGESEKTTQLRYTTTRAALMKNYGFYKDDFFPFDIHDDLSLDTTWKSAASAPNAPI